jgi:hypothetical protein
MHKCSPLKSKQRNFSMEAVELCYCFTSVFNELFMGEKSEFEIVQPIILRREE